MADKRDQGRAFTHDTGSQASRPRDDLRTASQKAKPKEKRDDGRDRDVKDEENDGEDKD